MNSYGSRLTLYIVIVLILGTGLALLIWRQSVVAALQPSVNFPAPASFVAASGTLDVSVLSAPALKSLVQQGSGFAFDNICSRPEAAPPVAAAATDQAGAAPAGSGAAVPAAAPLPLINCVQGNDLPFLGKTK